ncbi:aldo/keto reductase [Leucobacter allii]|uniref:aldo/keto reductase n=1 Tax=Leucobacter allii TaxID=2932247 RepID=UPI001FD454B1|nr:aldo/keto reductase [Leucobacter allii]UOR01344.1 aldo/keto reductase [Leucobacter allii]
MEYRPFGSTGIDVSAVSFGTAPLGGLFGPVPFEQAREAVFAAVDLGVNLIDTSSYYGDAEERLGRMTGELPGDVLLATKAGRLGWDEFDFSREGIRRSLERSLRLLGRDSVDVFQLHDIDFRPLDPILGEACEALQELKREGKCRFVGMTCYSLPTTRRVMLETDVDVVLNYAHGTLLDDSLTAELAPIARERGIALMNAAAVSLGILVPGVVERTEHNIASGASLAAAQRMARSAAERGVDIAFLANQYALQRVDAATTVVGTTSLAHLRSAVDALSAPIDAEALAAALAHRLPLAEQQWVVGLPENEDWSWLAERSSGPQAAATGN